MEVHSADSKFCHYFNNEKPCPYEEFGCKFKHEKSSTCSYGQRCNNTLCQFQHKQTSTEAFKENDTPVDLSTNDIIDDKIEVECTTFEEKSDESFYTSTPKRIRLQCKECLDRSQCTTCYVDTFIQNRETS